MTAKEPVWLRAYTPGWLRAYTCIFSVSRSDIITYLREERNKAHENKSKTDEYVFVYKETMLKKYKSNIYLKIVLKMCNVLIIAVSVFHEFTVIVSHVSCIVSHIPNPDVYYTVHRQTKAKP